MRSLLVLDDATPAEVPSAACERLARDALSRRAFLSATALGALAGALASACGGGDAGGATGPIGIGNAPATGVTYAGGVVTISLAQVPKLAAPGGYLITNGDGNDVRGANGAAPNVIVVNVGGGSFAAFTSVCTHEQCTVGEFANARIRCFCHGSEFDATGRAVVGPATRALAAYPVAVSGTTLTIQRG